MLEGWNGHKDSSIQCSQTAIYETNANTDELSGHDIRFSKGGIDRIMATNLRNMSELRLKVPKKPTPSAPLKVMVLT